MAKATHWAATDAEARKLGERTGLDTTGSPSPKRSALGCGQIHLVTAVAKVISAAPGEYGRKAETQRELTGAHTTGGGCCLIRSNAKKPYLGP